MMAERKQANAAAASGNRNVGVQAQGGDSSNFKNPQQWTDPRNNILAGEKGMQSVLHQPSQVPPTLSRILLPSLLSIHTTVSDDLISTPNRTFGVKGPVTSWHSFQAMPHEISQYAIDPAIWTDAKTDDIARHTHDDKLDPFQRAIVCMNGDISQKIYGAHDLPNLVKINTEKAFQEIFPIIAAELNDNPSVDFHAEVARSLVTVFKDMVKARNTKRVKTILEFVTASIDHENEEIAATWMEALEGIIDVMSPKDSLNKIVPIIQEKVLRGKSSLSKRAGCVLIRKLAQRVPDSTVPQMALPLIQTLARDEDNVVRSSVCMVLAELMIKSDPALFQEYMKLLTPLALDGDGLVSTCLVDSIGRLLISDSFKMNVKTHEFKIIISILKKSVKDAYYQQPQNIPLLVHFSRYVASMANKTNDLLTNDDKVWFVDAFLQMCRFDLPKELGNFSQEVPIGFVTYQNRMLVNRRPSLSKTLIGTPPQVLPNPMKVSARRPSAPLEELEKWMARAYCAAHLADFIKFAKPLVEFKSGLYPLITNLTRDPNPNVRKNLAASLCPVMEDVGENAALLKDEVIKLFSDDNVDVIEAIVPNLARIMKVFVKTNVVSPENTTQAMSDLGGVILFCEERLNQTRDWRVHSSLLLQLVALPFCMPCDHIYHNFVPILVHRLMHLTQLPTRLGAAEALISFLRNCRRANQRNEVRRKIRGFAHSRSAQDRMLYLYMSSMIMDRFSRKYFREHFFETTLHLAEDRIPNVRTKAVRLMPKMKEKLKMSEDSQSLTKLNEVLNRLQKSENDREALAAIEFAVEEMAKITAYLKNDPDHKMTKEDKDDSRKEKEENYIAGLEARMPQLAHRKLSGGTDKPSEVQKAPNTTVAPVVHTYAPAAMAARSGLISTKPQPVSKGAEGTPLVSPKARTSSGRSKDYHLPTNSANIVPLAKGKRTDSFLTKPLKDTDSSRTTSTAAGGKRKTTQTWH